MNVTVETYTFPSADGISQCAGIAVIPEEHPRALLEISHGMAEHIRRYLPMMQTLAANGILCFGHDHIGHGASVQSEKDLGYLPRKQGAAVLVGDVLCDGERFRGCYPGVPLIMLGHSMGSFIARLAASDDKTKCCDGLILHGTGSGNPLAGICMALLTVLCKGRGERAYSPKISAMMFDPYNDRFEKRTPFDWLSSDRASVDRYIADPLCGFPFTVSALYTLLSLLRDCNRTQTYRKTPDDLPILLMAGRDDPVGNYGVGVHAIADAYLAANCSRVSRTLYTDCRHELLQEPMAEQVISDMRTWIFDHIINRTERSTTT